MNYRLLEIPISPTSNFSLSSKINSKILKIIKKNCYDYYFLMLSNDDEKKFEIRNFISLNTHDTTILENNKKLMYIDTIELPTYYEVLDMTGSIKISKNEISVTENYSIFEIVDIQREFEF
jgi:hypothetical protein